MQGIGVEPTMGPMTGMAEFPQLKNRPAAKSIDPAIDPDMLMPAPTTMNEQWSYKVARPAAKSIDPTNPETSPLSDDMLEPTHLGLSPMKMQETRPAAKSIDPLPPPFVGTGEDPNQVGKLKPFEQDEPERDLNEVGKLKPREKDHSERDPGQVGKLKPFEDEEDSESEPKQVGKLPKRMDVGKPKKSRPKRMKVHDDDSENELEIGHKDSDAPVAMSGIGKKPKKGAKPMKLNVKHHKEPQLELGVDPDHGSMSTALGHGDSDFDPNTELSSRGKEPVHT